MISWTVFFLVTSYVLEYWIVDVRKKEISWGRSAATYNNLLYGVLCGIYCLVFMIRRIYPTHLCMIGCDPVLLDIAKDPELQIFVYVFYISKIYEFQDLVYQIVSHPSRSIALYFRFHHVTTLSVVWASFYYDPSAKIGACTLMSIWSNVFHHFWMYLFLGGIKPFRTILLFTGTAQLFFGFVCAYSTFTNSGWNEYYNFLIYFGYALGWAHELYLIATFPKPKQS